MKDKVHIMVDIETLGVSEGATVIQLAAASFCIETGMIYSTFERKVDIEKVNNLSVDGSTLKWWLNTDRELLTEILNKGKGSESDLFYKFYFWLLDQGKPSTLILWGNGIAFDNVKIKQKMESFNLEYPIFFRNERDVRTILALASAASGFEEKAIRSSVELEDQRAHDALDDVVFQVRYVCKCFSLLTSKSKEVAL